MSDDVPTWRRDNLAAGEYMAAYYEKQTKKVLRAVRKRVAEHPDTDHSVFTTRDMRVVLAELDRVIAENDHLARENVTLAIRLKSGMLTAQIMNSALPGPQEDDGHTS